MKQKELKFDIEKLNDMKSKLVDTTAELENCKEEVINSLEDLKEKWNTKAGKKFMSNVNTDWTAEVDKYIKIIGAVEELLQEAAIQYATVEEEMEGLKFYT